MTSFKENDPEIQDGLLTFYNMNLILIRTPGLSTEIERQSKEIERWKDEADSVLVFVCASFTIICIFLRNNMFKAGLFSAVGTVSLVESYKWLSPDSGDETVEVLDQLVNVTQKISLTPGSAEPFKRTFDIVSVNVFWFASITICIVCAVLATLLQQWARRYLALAEGGDTPEERARVRNFLYRSLRRFQLPWMYQLLGMGLHFSIALYSLGILLFIFHIDRNLVIYAIFGFFPFFSTYVALTMLPIFFLDSPYNTPFSVPVWCIWHFLLTAIFSICSGIANRLSSLPPGRLVNFLQNRASKHRRRCADGLERTVERYAKDYYT